jgi:hypothetical protein
MNTCRVLLIAAVQQQEEYVTELRNCVLRLILRFLWRQSMAPVPERTDFACTAPSLPGSAPPD